jgi:hypothetical protein
MYFPGSSQMNIEEKNEKIIKMKIKSSLQSIDNYKDRLGDAC